MDNSLRVALYARVSSERQAEELTIQSQVAALRERIRSDRMKLDNELAFLDEGYSGSTLVRPALERLRDLAYCGGVDRLYVHSPDRLTRKYVYQFLLLEEFRKHEVEVVFLNDIAPSDSPEGNLLVQMQGMIAEFERAKILERTRRGRRFAARQGKVSALGHAPYGYRYVPKHEAGGEARYEVVSDQAKLVEEMFTWVGVEGLSLGDVSRRLHQRALPTVTGKSRWDRATIRGILTNPAYAGTAKFGKTRLFPRKNDRRPKRGDPPTPRREHVARATSPEEQESIAVPALVSAELFAAVEDKLAENRRRHREHKKGAEFLLSGLLVCERCGTAYCGRRHRSSQKTEYVYYRCLGTDKYRHGGVKVCTNASVNGQLETVVWSDLCSLLKEPDRLRREFERRLEKPASDNADQTRVQQAITQSKRRLARLLDAYEEGWVDKPEFERRMTSVREKLARLEKELKEHQQAAFEENELRLVVTEFEAFAQQMTAGLDQADFATQRQLLKLLIKRIEINVKEVRIVYKVPLRPFVNSPSSGGFLQDCLNFHNTAQGREALRAHPGKTICPHDFRFGYAEPGRLLTSWQPRVRSQSLATLGCVV
jgi:site-specific DNA recombinase